MKRIALAGLLLAMTVVITACGGTHVAKGQQQENNQQKRITQEVVANQPLPSSGYSQMRQTLIEVEQAQIKGEQTTSFFFNQGVADPVKVCPSIGTPIPNTASLSNPDQVVSGGNSNGYGIVTVGQMDPNGIYTPQGSTGTYVLCVNNQGKAYVSYWEGFVQTEYAPAVWDYAHHRVVDTGAPTAAFTKTR